jgi:hypothetical protein
LRADPSHSVQAGGIGIPYLIPFLLNTPQELNFYAYCNNSPVNLIDPLGLACGPGQWGDLIIPDAPDGYDFTICCQRHDDCYGSQCHKSKKQCDDEFYECMARLCGMLYFSKKCFIWADRYWSAVDKWGNRTFEKVRSKEPCCQKF